MPTPEFRSRGIAIGNESKGERFVSHALLTIDFGVIHLLSRRSETPGKRIAIDLFDDGEFRFERRPGGGPGFLKDAQISRRRRGLAKRYPSLEAAVRFTRLIRANPTHAENRQSVYNLLDRGLEAWESGKEPQATYLKCIYLYCRQEGYPVKEQWAQTLPPSDFQQVVRILNHPLEDAIPDTASLARIIDKLERYIQASTHIRLGP